jgi:two-component system, OmpR family, response regulator CpxR
VSAILVIDDDKELCSLLSKLFKNEELLVRFCHDGKQGLELAQQGSFDLVVLDIMLPSLDGLRVLRELRKHSLIPVIMLTARGEDIDRIVGLELGADDYLPKPFNSRELLARIRSVMRRTKERSLHVDQCLDANGVTLDPASREVFVEGNRIEVTTFEFDLLENLMRAAGRVLPRDQVIESIYRRQPTPFDRSIDMHISHLRKKVGEGRIKTIRGVGYQFVGQRRRRNE